MSSKIKVKGVPVEATQEEIEKFRDKKVWSLWANYFGEVNSYMLTYDEAVKMIDAAVDEDGFEEEDLIIYIPEKTEKEGECA